MKIVASIFLLIVTFFTVQPLLGSHAKNATKTCCLKAKKCGNNSDPGNENRKCGTDGCNPFLACASGNLYLLEKGGFTFQAIVCLKDNKVTFNDNRLSTGLSESWHPPEFDLPFN